jgi:flagellar hook assembly protein FlgD
MDEASGSLTPRVFALNANYPNPFNPMTKISFSLPEAQDVRLEVYAVDGRRVATLINEQRGPGLHEVIWNGLDDSGRQASSGMYFYRIDAGPYSAVQKMTLMK